MPETQHQELYKAVYDTAFSIAKKYFSHYPLPRSYSFFIEVENSLIDSYKADKAYPLKFGQEMLNTVCKWFLAGYAGMTKDDIPTIFNSAWAFHRAYMGVQLDDAAWDAILDGANAAAEKLPKCAAGIFIAVLHELERVNNKTQTETI